MPDSSLDEYGWSLDFSALKRIIDQFDHKTLNDFMEFPSAENVARRIWEDVYEVAKGKAKSITVDINEGHGNSLVYLGPDEE